MRRVSAADVALLVLRLVVAARLFGGTVDNVVSWAQMEEFARFLAAHGVPAPASVAAAVTSVAVQFIGGLLLAAGLAARVAGALLVVNFAVALALVHRADTLEGAFPALVLLAVALYIAAAGAGALSVDAWRARTQAAARR